MTVVNSNIFRLNVIDVGTSALLATINGTGASGYSTPMTADSWRQHLTATNMDPALNSPSGTPDTMLVFINTMPWNPVAKRIEIYGSGHPGPTKYTVYDDSGATTGTADHFQRLITDMGPTGVGMTHGYDMVTLNPYTGDVYSRNYGSTSIIYKKSPAWPNPVFTQITATRPSPGTNFGVAIGMCWWSGAWTPTGGTAAGAHGCLMIFGGEHAYTASTPDFGRILAYDPLADAWIYNQQGRGPGGGGSGTGGNAYQMVMEYSSIKNCAVYGGGVYNHNELWKMDQFGNVTSFQTYPNTNFPAGTTLNVGSTGGKLVNDPVYGNFLLLSIGQLWGLNPDNGVWTALATPPISGLNPDTGNGSVEPVAIEEYGVVVFLVKHGVGGTVWIYKPKSL